MFEIKFKIDFYCENKLKIQIKLLNNIWKILSIQIINKLSQNKLNILINNYSFIGDPYENCFYLRSDTVLFDNSQTKKEIEFIEDIIGNEILKYIEKNYIEYKNIKIVSVVSNLVRNCNKRKIINFEINQEHINKKIKFN